MSGLRVLESGFLTTVQDLGRPGFAIHGVATAGAADPVALRLGNRLVGNARGAAALELTLTGGTFRFEGDAVLAFAGADPKAEAGGSALAPWTAHPIPSGTTIRCGALTGGARSYLCVRGGLDVPRVLGSASTHLAAGLGGLGGRPLRAGDRLAIASGALWPLLDSRIDPLPIPGYRAGAPFRVVDGVQSGWFDDEARREFFSAAWTVGEACDRMGIRMTGPALRRRDTREMVTEGVTRGAVQVPGGGSPIVLLVEAPTTGGYPKIACVIAADLARLGQIRPRDRVRFESTTLRAASAAAEAQEGALAATGA
jgi:biotin-dependent carboxylase-like uncharacterized protein